MVVLYMAPLHKNKPAGAAGWRSDSNDAPQNASQHVTETVALRQLPHPLSKKGGQKKIARRRSFH
jgi:hypothetical protein